VGFDLVSRKSVQHEHCGKTGLTRFVWDVQHSNQLLTKILEYNRPFHKNPPFEAVDFPLEDKKFQFVGLPFGLVEHFATKSLGYPLK